jgi:hypothetical protein
MVRPQIADGDDLQIWRVAADILKQQSRTADKGWSSACELGVGLTTHHKKISLLQKSTRSLGSGQILLINDLSGRKWT